MKITSTYKTKILHYNKIFNASIKVYRKAVDYFISVCLSEWDVISPVSGLKNRKTLVETFTIPTKQHPEVKYCFPEADRQFQKFPSYLRRAAIAEAIGKIKKAQQHGAKKMPRLWGKAKGINRDIAVKTANFIIDMALRYNADVIVMEALDTSQKKQGSKKQRLHHWKAKAVQSMVTDKAYRFGMRVSRICARGTSGLAYDGSGTVLRGKDAGLASYSVCRFQTGKVYNCDLSASYNIGARYFIRETLKSLPEKVKLDVLAKVPELSKRTTCTLSSLIRMHAALCS